MHRHLFETQKIRCHDDDGIEAELAEGVGKQGCELLKRRLQNQAETKPTRFHPPGSNYFDSAGSRHGNEIVSLCRQRLCQFVLLLGVQVLGRLIPRR